MAITETFPRGSIGATESRDLPLPEGHSPAIASPGVNLGEEREFFTPTEVFYA